MQEENIKETKKTSNKETVKIRLPIGKGEEDDVYVSVNDYSYLIKRGETVEVPVFVAEVLKQREIMLEKAYMQSRGAVK